MHNLILGFKPSGKYVMEDVHKVGFSKNILSCAFNSLLLLKMAEETSFLAFCEDIFFLIYSLV